MGGMTMDWLNAHPIATVFIAIGFLVTAIIYLPTKEDKKIMKIIFGKPQKRW